MPVEAFVIGLAISFVFIEITGLYPGGLIVPAYFAVYLDQPLRIIGTFVVACSTWLIYRVLAHWLILFGRRRFALLVLLGSLLGMCIYRVLPVIWPASLELRIIGWVIPGLIANAFERQGFVVTTLGLIIASILTYFVLHLVIGFTP